MDGLTNRINIGGHIDDVPGPNSTAALAGSPMLMHGRPTDGVSMMPLDEFPISMEA